MAISRQLGIPRRIDGEDDLTRLYGRFEVAPPPVVPTEDKAASSEKANPDAPYIPDHDPTREAFERYTSGDQGSARTSDFLGEGTNSLPDSPDQDPWARDKDGNIIYGVSGDPITKEAMRAREWNLQREYGPGDIGYREERPTFEGPNGESLEYDPYERNDDGSIKTRPDQQGKPLKVTTDRYAEEYGADAGVTTRPSTYYPQVGYVGDLGPTPYLSLVGTASAHRLGFIAPTLETMANDPFVPEWVKAGAREQAARGIDVTAGRNDNEATKRAMGLADELGLSIDSEGNMVTPDGRVVSHADGSPGDFNPRESIETQLDDGSGSGSGGGTGGDFSGQGVPQEGTRRALDRLMAFSQGSEGPSEAEALMTEALDKAAAQSLGIAAGARGGAGAVERATRQAVFSNAAQANRASQQIAAIRAQEAEREKARRGQILKDALATEAGLDKNELDLIIERMRDSTTRRGQDMGVPYVSGLNRLQDRALEGIADAFGLDF